MNIWGNSLRFVTYKKLSGWLKNDFLNPTLPNHAGDR